MNWNGVPLEAALTETAAFVDFPEPDVASTVLARITILPLPVPGRTRWSPWTRSPAWIAAAVLVGISSVLVLSPRAREAVADFVGEGPIRVHVEATPPAPTITAPDLGLGSPIEIADVRDLYGSVELPTLLGTPERIYLGEFKDFVAYVYDPSATLPEIGDIGAGLVFFRFTDFSASEYLEKILGPDAAIRKVRVRGVDGYWAHATEHMLSFDSHVRVAGNALLWSESGITYRIESSLTLREAKLIAESIERL